MLTQTVLLLKSTLFQPKMDLCMVASQMQVLSVHSAVRVYFIFSSGDVSTLSTHWITRWDIQNTDVTQHDTRVFFFCTRVRESQSTKKNREQDTRHFFILFLLSRNILTNDSVSKTWQECWSFLIHWRSVQSWFQAERAFFFLFRKVRPFNYPLNPWWTIGEHLPRRNVKLQTVSRH